MSHKSGVAGKDVYLYAGVMTEALQATIYCPLTLHGPSAIRSRTKQQQWVVFPSRGIEDDGAGYFFI